MDISEADSPPPLSPCSTTTESLCRQVRDDSSKLHEILALVPRDRPDPNAHRSPKAKDAKPSKKSKKSPKSPKTPKSKSKKGGKKKNKKSKAATKEGRKKEKKKAKSEGDEGARKAPAPGSRLSHPWYHEGAVVTLPLHLIWRLLTEEQQEVLVQMKYLNERRVA